MEVLRKQPLGLSDCGAGQEVFLKESVGHRMGCQDAGLMKGGSAFF